MSRIPIRLPASRPKYFNRRTNGFASKRESDRFSMLVVMQVSGVIRNLVCQKKYELRINGVLICTYIADFVYEELTDSGWIEVVEDSKGMRTPVYRLKKKLMLAIHGITIKET